MQTTTPADNSFFFREKEELPWAGLEPAMFCVLGRHKHVHVHAQKDLDYAS